jgi:hypothetical protein
MSWNTQGYQPANGVNPNGLLPNENSSGLSAPDEGDA